MAHHDTFPSLGDPSDRVEAKAKVTGTAKYAAEYQPDGLAYGVLVTSSIARGRIISLDTRRAIAVPGVITILSHLNRPHVPGWDRSAGSKGDNRLEGQSFRVFFDDAIHFNQQPIALVVAERLEQAKEAAAKITALYRPTAFETNPLANIQQAVKAARSEDYARGDITEMNSAPIKVAATYHTPIQVHNPMEMHAATAAWKGDTVTVYNKTQAVKIAQKEIMSAFGLKEEQVQIHSPFVGGAFGSSSRVWPQEMAAILGAKKTGRPVTVMAARDQVFNMVGYRPQSVQHLTISANRDGLLTALKHEAFTNTSRYEEFVERIIDPTRSMHACTNLQTYYRLVPVDMSTPSWARGPGETSGSFALECAMDELSYAVGIDPLELRLRNFAERDPYSGKPWSSNYLKECYQRAAARFGWARRNPAPASMHDGEWLIGLGMSAGIYKAERAPASASATLRQDGTLLVQTSVADVGPGSATVMAQIAAVIFGVPMSQVVFEWGSSMLPPAPGQFGSHTTISTGSAVHDAVKGLQERLKELAVNQRQSPFFGKRTEDLHVISGTVSTEGSVTVPCSEILKKSGLAELKVMRDSKPGPETEQFAGKSFCAHFVEVRVHRMTGEARVKRVVSAIDAGKIINRKTAMSQIQGAITWGIGIALMEEGLIDHRYGRYVNHNLSDYHVPVHTDMPVIEVDFIDQPDPVIDPMGAKGLGEIGIVGFTAAVANAVYHATGKRIRSLPITPDKLL